MGAWTPRLQAVSNQVKGVSGRIKVWSHVRSTRRSHETSTGEELTNPIYILAAITLGIPALLLIPLVGMNPGVQDGTLVTVLSFLVLSAFLTAAVFEVKRLADQPSDEEHH
jgi:Ni/Fe-hydrogenase subunit HybB-like protein